LNYHIKDNSFDLVLCTEVLEHLESPEKALKELVRSFQKIFGDFGSQRAVFSCCSISQRQKTGRALVTTLEHINHWTVFGFPQFVKKKRQSSHFGKKDFPSPGPCCF